MTARSGLSSPGRGVGVPGQRPAGERCLSPSSGSCLRPPRRERWGGQGRGERQIKTKTQKRTCKAHKRQLKGKQEDTISESTKNKVSNVSLTRATQTSSFHTRASDLVRARDTVTVTLLAASAAHTFCLKKNPNNLQGNLSVTLVAKVGNARKQSARLNADPEVNTPGCQQPSEFSPKPLPCKFHSSRF